MTALAMPSSIRRSAGSVPASAAATFNKKHEFMLAESGKFPFARFVKRFGTLPITLGAAAAGGAVATIGYLALAPRKREQPEALPAPDAQDWQSRVQTRKRSPHNAHPAHKSQRILLVFIARRSILREVQPDVRRLSMLRTLSFAVMIMFGFCAFTMQSAQAAMTEQQKIDALLADLDSPDVTFIRNGTAMSGKDAKAHLLDKQKELKVTTAQDFIAKVATQSRESGKPYMIKAKDGKEVASAEWFETKLKALDSK